MRFYTQPRLLTSAFAASLFIQSVCSVPTSPYKPVPGAPHRRYEYGVDRHSFIKRQTNYFATTGVHVGSGPGGSTPQRLEVRELEKDTTMWTLYILGLDMLQWTPQEDLQSWYQIMGIHGRPYLPFDNVPAGPGGEGHGYCTHASILFPTWHRPYLAMYEQVLHGLIQQIAAMYPAGAERDKYVAAAPNFRVPFWDWAAAPAAGMSVLPDSVGGSPGMNVDGPAGNQTIANPLWSFQFQPLNTTELPNPPFTMYKETLRYPTTADGSAVSQNDQVRANLDKNVGTFRSRLYNLFTNYPDYSTFSNEAWIPDGSTGDFDSIESIHDQIHGFSGGGGHMTYIDYAAFDPLFMLHHSNVDRCFAIWQEIFSTSYVQPTPAKFATFTISAGSIEDASTPLEPFHNPSGAFWDSNSVQHTEAFGYVYPETANSTGIDRKAQAIAAVNTLYGPNAAGSTTANLGNREVLVRNTENGVTYREWIANILVSKHALSGPFFIHFFLGPINENPKQWVLEPSLIGSHVIFDKIDSNTSNTPCNCTDDKVTGTIPLTASLNQLVDSEVLPSLEPTDVEPYITKNLRFKLSYLNYTEVPASQVPSLLITTVTSEVQKAASLGVLPVWGRMVDSIDVVEG